MSLKGHYLLVISSVTDFQWLTEQSFVLNLLSSYKLKSFTMLRNLTKPTRCFASHLNIRSQVCKKYASNDLCLKTVSEQILKNNYATAARTANRKFIFEKILPYYITINFRIPFFILSKQKILFPDLKEDHYTWMTKPPHPWFLLWLISTSEIPKKFNHSICNNNSWKTDSLVFETYTEILNSYQLLVIF